MTNLFIRILNMSLTGTLMILAVLALRLLLKRAPRIFSYGLWAVVLFRLLCPVSFESPFSLLGVLHAPEQARIEEYLSGTASNAQGAETVSVLPALGETVPGPEAGQSGMPEKSEGAEISAVGALHGLLPVGAAVWLTGACALFLWGLVSYAGTLLRLRRAEKTARDGQERVFGTNAAATPFVIGFFRPCIYLPENLPEKDLAYILLHERIHVRRGDHLTRAAAYLALCLHWFNPLVWLAFFLSGRDMEMSCDEAVLRRAGNQIKKEYSTSLLALASGHGITAGIPLAFGAGDLKGRIRNILRYRKPALWLTGLVLAVCVLTAVFLLGNPGRTAKEREKQIFYGVVTESEKSGGNVILIPGLGEMEIPDAEKVEPYYEIDFDGLIPGYLVWITFSPEEETEILETDPGRFSRAADSIQVMGEGFVLRDMPDGGYLLGVPLGMAPEAQEGDTLDIYHAILSEGTLLENYHLAVLEEPEKIRTELLTETPVLAVDPENYDILVELSEEDAETFLAEFGFGVSCELKKAEAQESSQLSEQKEETGSELAEPSGQEIDGQMAVSGEVPDGLYRVYVRSISLSSRCIDRYVLPFGMEEDEAVWFPAFAEDCVFYVNREMDRVRLEEIGFEEFAELVSVGTKWQNVEVFCTFRDGLIQRAELMSSYLGQGISYQPLLSTGSTWMEDLCEMEETSLEEMLAQFYELVRTEEADVSDAPGMERIEIYLGDVGDGDSGLVLFYDRDGNLLHTEDAHQARAGWNNVYAGERDGVPYLMTMHIEDREMYGEYWYQVFRLDEAGTPQQIAGSDFVWGEFIVYDDDLFRQWADGLESYLADAHLLLSSQEGELRAEAVCEADRYHYETLRRHRQ